MSGHTSTTGSYGHNIELSQNRALSVMNYLIKNSIAAEQLTNVGFGPVQPIAPNDTEANRQMNRRLEVKIIAK
ncbi:OmpA family protein [Bacteroidia bacterium]|nr:OmpA family protein [Bacteroidia bacterium]MDB9882979.1 OmpA family protein [Bacteroidia bacterium]